MLDQTEGRGDQDWTIQRHRQHRAQDTERIQTSPL